MDTRIKLSETPHFTFGDPWKYALSVGDYNYMQWFQHKRGFRGITRYAVSFWVDSWSIDVEQKTGGMSVGDARLRGAPWLMV